MASLTNLATKCRFAVLEVSDDSDEDLSPGVSDKPKAGSAKGADANSATKAKKKKKKKKNRAKSNQDVTTQVLNSVESNVSKNDQEIEEGEQTTECDEWNEWRQKDEQYVLSQFQRDLKEALEASKQEQQKKRQHEQESFHDESTQGISSENTKEKKKKEKAVVMSLDEFRMNIATEGTGDSAKTESQQLVRELDDFLDWQDDSTLNMKGSPGNVMSQGAPYNDVVLVEEKPPTSGNSVKSIGRKRNSSKSDSEVRNPEQVKQAVVEKKLLPASHEDQIQAEMVHIKDELDKTGHELIELRKTKEEHITIIENLKKELSQVKRRNKQLCFILSQAEMKEKSELLMQIEELNEVKEQVVQLHAELEQERSKNSALKNELAKLSGGRQRHGSSS